MDYLILKNRFGTLTIDKREDQKLGLCLIIISQMLSNKVSKSIGDRFKNYYHSNTTESFKVNELRTLGVSNSKSQTILDSLRFFDTNGVFEKEASDEHIRNSLLSIKGIGDWSVDIFLIFIMGRENIFPKNDVGVLNGLKKFYRIEYITEDFINSVKDRWSPYCSIGCLYMWKLIDEG